MSPYLTELRTGWRNLLAGAIGMGLGVGSYTTVSSLFFQALESQFGWSRAVAAGALIALPITALILPFAGWLIDRLGVRLVSGFSVIASAVCFAWLSQMKGAVGEYYAAIILLNVLGCASGPIAYTRLVAGQFHQSRGSALALTQFGIAAIAIIFPPILGTILLHQGWRAGYGFLIGSTLVGGLAAQLLMRPTRADRSGGLAGGMSVRSAMASPAFWVLGCALFAISVASLGLVSQFQAVLIERGISRAMAPWFLSLLATAVMFSRLFMGRLLDLPGPARWGAVVMAIAGTGAILLLFAGGNPILAGLAVAMVGISLGAEMDVMAFFCSRLFGLRRYAAIYGLLAAFFYTGIAAGGIGYGAVRDITGHYDAALWLGAALLFIAAGLFLILDRLDTVFVGDGDMPLAEATQAAL